MLRRMLCIYKFNFLVVLILKKIFITGASSEIGLELIELLINKDFVIYAQYNSRSNCLLTKFEKYSNIVFIKCDFSNDEDLKIVYESLNKDIDIFINISGKELEGLFTDFDDAVYEELTKVNLLTPLAILKKFIPNMVNNKFGKIVFITSIWGEIGAANEVMYSTLKGAQNTFVKALSKELAPSNINVNAVSPGAVDTKMLNSLEPTDIEILKSDIPLSRLAEPKEIATLVEFLISDKSNYITGQVIGINGGWKI
ncbi:MAG: fabG [Bacillales bacterium]|jgi:3-oxoacyl-[acyl-carrier protein] reductase|nr:fabG [Bacillales bacterium]